MRGLSKVILGTLFLMAVSALAHGTDGLRIIGRVGDVNVTADDLAKGGSPEEVFLAPAVAKYFESRKQLITPTEEELRIVEENIRSGMKDMEAKGDHSMKGVDPELVAKFLLDGWKYNTYLYDNFGGGRLLFQQAGVEAFDATHEFIKHLERNGYFKIEDAAIRDSAFSYWTRDHGAFVIDHEEDVRKWRDVKNLGR